VAPDQATTWLSILLGPAGLTVGLLALVWALYTEKLVPGEVARRYRTERDVAMRLARTGTDVTGRAVDLAEKRKET
jgi:hypothetical protein